VWRDDFAKKPRKFVGKLSPEDNARLHGRGEPLKLHELQKYFKAKPNSQKS